MLEFVAHSLTEEGYGEKEVEAFVREHEKRIENMGGRALAARALNEMGPRDFKIIEHGPH